LLRPPEPVLVTPTVQFFNGTLLLVMTENMESCVAALAVSLSSRSPVLGAVASIYPSSDVTVVLFNVFPSMLATTSSSPADILVMVKLTFSSF
jgi:hypothetical protein